MEAEVVEVQTVEVKLNVPKESKELVDFIFAIIAKAKSGAKLADYGDLLGEGTIALKGVNLLDEEAKSKFRGDLIAYFAKQVNDAF